MNTILKLVEKQKPQSKVIYISDYLRKKEEDERKKIIKELIEHSKRLKW